MEQKSKKITKQNKSTSHGRSKFEKEQAHYIAENIKAALKAGKLLLLKDIREMMFKLSKEFIEQGNPGKCITSIGTTIIYTFLEKHGIPAPQKVKQNFSEQSAEIKTGDSKTSEKIAESPSKSPEASNVTPQKIIEPEDDEQWLAERKKLESELQEHKNRILQIENRLKEIEYIKKNYAPFNILIDYSSQSGTSYDTDYKDLEELYLKESGQILEKGPSLRIKDDEVDLEHKQKKLKYIENTV